MEILIWTLAGVERKSGSEEEVYQGQGESERAGGQERRWCRSRGEERRNRRSESAEEHLSGLSALKQFATQGTCTRHKKETRGSRKSYT